MCKECDTFILSVPISYLEQSEKCDDLDIKYGYK